MNVYLKVVLIAAFCVFIFGFAMPTLISMRDSIGVILGVVLGLAFFPMAIWFVKRGGKK